MPYSQESAERFLQYYNRLDKFMRVLTHSSHTASHTEMLERIRLNKLNHVIAMPEHNDFLRDLSRLRNTIVHWEKEEGEVVALPLESVVARYADLVARAVSPPQCKELATPAESVLHATAGDSILDTARRMKKASYSHIPILERGVVQGVFSESSLYTFYTQGSKLVIQEDTPISQLGGVVKLEAHSSECFRFLPPDADMEDLLDLYIDRKYGRKRLVMVFLTQGGQPDGRLEGLLTIWDLLHYSMQGRD